MTEDSINEFKAKPLVLIVYELDPEYGWILATAIEVTSLKAYTTQITELFALFKTLNTSLIHCGYHSNKRVAQLPPEA